MKEDNFSDDNDVLDELYSVERILDKKKIKGIWKYKVKWEGYTEDECTWEPIENLDNVIQMVVDFNSEYENKPKPRGKILESSRDSPRELSKFIIKIPNSHQKT